MASPIANGHPSTPPSSDPAVQSPNPDLEIPLTSLSDDGSSRRPRDARLIHLVISSLGIHSYQERVPLQLLDFAYRYTSSVLSDSLRLAGEGYTAQNTTERGGNTRKGKDGTQGEKEEAGTTVTVTALRQAIASRTGYHFQGPLPKEFMLEQAEERNRLALPKVERSYGVLLPPEKYCLTGVGWNLKDEWDSDGTLEGEDDDVEGELEVEKEPEDVGMGGLDGAEDAEEEGAGRMEDVFGEDGQDTSME